MSTASASSAALENRLAEVLLGAMAPCDLGDGIEVVHDVEAVEIEMECSVDDDDDEPDRNEDQGTQQFERTDEHGTQQFVRTDEQGTQQFERFSAPYERIEIQLDANAYLRATISEAQTLGRQPTSSAAATAAARRAARSRRRARTQS